MTDHFARPKRAATSAEERVAALHRPVGIRTAAVPQADRPVVRHANGLEFRVIPADSYTARMARDVHQVTMADGTVWTVGQPVGWYGTPAAWRTTTAEAVGR